MSAVAVMMYATLVDDGNELSRRYQDGAFLAIVEQIDRTPQKFMATSQGTPKISDVNAQQLV